MDFRWHPPYSETLTQQFLRSVAFPLARPLIRLNVNPYYAHMSANMMSARQVANRMDWTCEPPEWRATLTHDECVEVVEGLRQGMVLPDCDMVIDFCTALDITPDQLVRPDHPAPAAPAVVEAAVATFAEMDEAGHSHPALRDFLAAEVVKARRWARYQRPGEPRNCDVLAAAEKFGALLDPNPVLTTDPLLRQLLNLPKEDPRATIRGQMGEWRRLFKAYGASVEARARDLSPIDLREPRSWFDQRVAAAISTAEHRIGYWLFLKEWVDRPETDVFLRAEAAARHILSEPACGLVDLRLDAPSSAEGRPLLQLPFARGPL